LEAFRQASLNFPEDSKNMERITVAVEHLSQVLSDCHEMLYHQGEPGTFVRAGHLVREQLNPALRQLMVQTSQYTEEHLRLQIEQERLESRAKSQLQTMLTFGILLQLLLGIASVVFLTHSITRRIGLLTDNASRLAHGEALHPLASGRDEVAQLDKVFHDMARALAEAASRERAVVDAMPVGFITLDSAGVIRSVNPRANLLLRSKSENLIGNSLGSIIVSPHTEAPQETLGFKQICEKALAHVTEFRFMRSDGTTFPGELSLNRVIDSTDSLIVCNILDVSERYEIERMKREFVSIVSHDLKTPLSSIQASLQMVSKGIFGDLNDSGKKVIRGSQEEAVRLIKLINDLLDLARIESGRIELECEEVALSSALVRAVNSVESFARERGVALSPGQTKAQVWADEDRLVQVLVNLLSNAIKYSNAGDTVTISTIQDSNEIEVRITDRGCGIPDSVQREIFERFGQSSSIDRKEKGGTGLGLAICKLIVEAHGGTIGVRSQVGHGSTFWFRLRTQAQLSITTTPTAAGQEDCVA
jgi:PAS domain S-box-containing protein